MKGCSASNFNDSCYMPVTQVHKSYKYCKHANKINKKIQNIIYSKFASDLQRPLVAFSLPSSIPYSQELHMYDVLQ